MDYNRLENKKFRQHQHMEKTSQRRFRFTVEPREGGLKVNHAIDIKVLNEPERQKIPREKLLCDLLKRQARRAMVDITECPSVALPANLARLDDLRETIDLVFRHEFVPYMETIRSECNLSSLHTLADFRACLEITKREHRAPVFVNSRDDQFQKIWHGLELIAGQIATLANTATPEIFTNLKGENER